MATFKEVYQFECDVFSPETSQKSEKELKAMLLKHYGYFPKQENGSSDEFKPYDPNNSYSVLWFKCYDHLTMLIAERKNEFKYKLSLYVSYLAILISIVSVLVRVLF